MQLVVSFLLYHFSTNSERTVRAEKDGGIAPQERGVAWSSNNSEYDKRRY
jgi:hypothetical protein